jgi:hypothetical protein
MKFIFAIAVLVLGLGDIVSLLPLPFGSAESYSEFLIGAWFLEAGILAFTIFIGVLLLRIKNHWVAFALCLCLVKVIIWWWWWGGSFDYDVSMMKFLEIKLSLIQTMLHHSNAKVVFIAIHRDIVVGVFYHLALLGFLFVVIKNWINKLAEKSRAQR